MAKVIGNATKTLFGQRRVGKAQKQKGPKQKHVKKYRGQGR